MTDAVLETRGLGKRFGPRHDVDGAARIQRLNDVPAELAQVVVDDHDRNLAQDLIEIWLRVINTIDKRRQHQKDEGSAGPQHPLPFGGEGSADAAH